MELSAYKEWIVIGFIVLVLFINIWLFTSLKKGKSSSTIQVLKKSAATLKDPFIKENADLNELADLVQKIKLSKDKKD
mgnify:FL=1